MSRVFPLCLSLTFALMVSPYQLRANEGDVSSANQNQKEVETPKAFNWSVQLTPRFYIGRNDINQSAIHPETGEYSFSNYLSPSVDSQYTSTYIYTAGDVPYEFGNQAGAIYMRLDTGEIYREGVEYSDEDSGETVVTEEWLSNGQTLNAEFQSTYFIRQIFLEHQFGSNGVATLRLGKGNPVVGYGFVYNDFSPYLSVTLNFEPWLDVPVQVSGTLISPSDGLLPESSFIQNLELTYIHPKWGKFMSFWAHLRDRDDSMSGVLRQMIAEAGYVPGPNGQSTFPAQGRGLLQLSRFSSSSDVNWWGGGYEKSWSGGQSLWARAAYSQGAGLVRMDMTRFLRFAGRRGSGPSRMLSPIVDVNLNYSGWAADVGTELPLGQKWSLSGFAVALSGDEGLGALGRFFRAGGQTGEVNEELGAFVSVMPYLGYTNIFFNGGLDQGFSNRQATLSGLAGRGVLASGFSVSGPIWGKLSYQGGPALIHSFQDSPHGSGRFYGIELDNALSFPLGWDITLDLQVDLMRTGSFFPQQVWMNQTTAQITYAPSGFL